MGWGKHVLLVLPMRRRMWGGIELGKGLIGTEIWPKILNRKMADLLNGPNYAKAAIDIAARDLMGKFF
jgi:L-alanine-DL-glutamate epimerase-like enolase superfamily enzyme